MYEIEELAYINCQKIVQALMQSKQNMISCFELNVLNHSLNKAKEIKKEVKEVKSEK
jgi:hypothetical protein